jgi:hypothetical protein
MSFASHITADTLRSGDDPYYKEKFFTEEEQKRDNERKLIKKIGKNIHYLTFNNSVDKLRIFLEKWKDYDGINHQNEKL